VNAVMNLRVLAPHVSRNIQLLRQYFTAIDTYRRPRSLPSVQPTGPAVVKHLQCTDCQATGCERIVVCSGATESCRRFDVRINECFASDLRILRNYATLDNHCGALTRKKLFVALHGTARSYWTKLSEQSFVSTHCFLSVKVNNICQRNQNFSKVYSDSVVRRKDKA
jgi:hypothetical protein